MATPPTPSFLDPIGAATGWRGRWRQFWRRRGHWWLLTVGMVALTSVLTVMQPFPSIDRMLLDNARAAMGQQATGQVVVVAIDDPSLDAIGRLPWRRTVHAQLLRQISAQGPRCIGLNLPLGEEDGLDNVDDPAMAQAMRDSGCVVLPMALDQDPDQEHVGTEATPVPLLAAAAAGIGHAHLARDEDGLVRGFYLREGFAGRMWPHFALALMEAGQARASHQPPPAHPALPPPAGVQAPWLREGRELIVATRGDRPFTTVSAHDVLNGRVAPALFRDRYVLIGITAVGWSNLYGQAVPSQTGLMPGVVVFANVLQGLLSGRHVREATVWENLGFSVLPLIVVLVGLLWLRPLPMLALIASMLALRLGLHTLRPWVGVQFLPAVGFMALLAVYPAWMLIKLSALLRYLGWATQQLNAEARDWPVVRAPIRRGDFLDQQLVLATLAASRLRDLQRFVRDGIHHLPDATMVLNPEGRVMVANFAAERHWEAPPDSLLGRDAHALLADLRQRDGGSPMVPPGALQTSLQPVVDEGEDERGRILLVRCVPFFSDDRERAGWMIALVDITRMRQAQQQRDEALRFISHDIREPNASILTLLALTRTRPTLMPHEQLLDRIGRHAQTGLDLADGFVSLARAEAQAFQREALDLVALLDEAIDGAWGVAQERDVRVQTHPGPEEAPCMGDRSLLSRAIGNVLSNALKYSPPGGTVWCGVRTRGRSWALSVRDQGPGVSPEMQSQLFQPFHRLHRDTHPQVHGVGLGLLLVRTALQRHGGTVEIDSAVDAGCTVTLVLPQPATAELAEHFPLLQ